MTSIATRSFESDDALFRAVYAYTEHNEGSLGELNAYFQAAIRRFFAMKRRQQRMYPDEEILPEAFEGVAHSSATILSVSTTGGIHCEWAISETDTVEAYVPLAFLTEASARHSFGSRVLSENFLGYLRELGQSGASQAWIDEESKRAMNFEIWRNHPSPSNRPEHYQTNQR